MELPCIALYTPTIAYCTWTFRALWLVVLTVFGSFINHLSYWSPLFHNCDTVKHLLNGIWELPLIGVNQLLWPDFKIQNKCSVCGKVTREKLHGTISIWRYRLAIKGILIIRIMRSQYRMMTSSNGNMFRVTGHLCGEFTGHRWIPLTKASDAELLMFSLICAWIHGWVNNRDAGDLRLHRAHYDVTVM